MKLKTIFTESIRAEKITQAELQEVYDSLDHTKKISKLSVNNIKIGEVKNNYWFSCLGHNKDYRIVVIRQKGKLHKYVCNIVDDDKNEQRTCDTQALKLLKDKFTEFNGIEFKKAFGVYKDPEILRCVPQQLYIMPYKHQLPIIDVMSSADFSSNYPANACGLLPDMNKTKRLKGRHYPTKEYPFAFYLKSGHSAQYQVYDTHDWLTSKYAPNFFRWKTYSANEDEQYPFTDDNEEITLLAKASNFNLDDTWQFFYSQKASFKKDTKEYKAAKLVMNASIGQCHRRRYTRDYYAAIAIVAIARANNNMFNIVRNYGLDIIQVQVDGIIYKGDKKIGTDKIKLGALEQEFTGRLTKYIGLGRYMAVDNEGNKVKMKHQGCNKCTTGKDIEDSNTFEDMETWYTEVKKAVENINWEI